MAKYTIEDIEILRQKSGISYEEAVNLLEYHNGSLARALVDLEKNGRLRNEKGSNAAHKGAKGLFDTLYRIRFKIRKGETAILNLSALFMLLVAITAPHILVIGLIASLALGYSFKVVRDRGEFAGANFDDMVKNAGSNMRSALHSFTRQFSESGETAQQTAANENHRTEKAASGTRPVNVQFPDGGSVNVRDDGDGYHEADIH